MDKIIKCITFIPWILYFIEIILYRIGVIETCKLNKEKYFNHMSKNMFSTINIKELILFFIFLLFLQKENTLVLEILFPVIYIYILIDFFHTLAYDCKKIKNKSLMVLSVCLVVALVLFFMITGKLYTTYILMFIASILNAFLIYIFSWLTKPFRKAPKNK